MKVNLCYQFYIDLVPENLGRGSRKSVVTNNSKWRVQQFTHTRSVRARVWVCRVQSFWAEVDDVS